MIMKISNELTIITSIDLNSHRYLVPPSHGVYSDVLRYDRHLEFVLLDRVSVVIALEHLGNIALYF